MKPDTNEGDTKIVRPRGRPVYFGRNAHRRMAAEVQVDASIDLTVIRGVNSLRVTMLGVLVGIALTVAFGVNGVGVGWRVGTFIGTFIGVAVASHFLFHGERSRHLIMRFAHWIIGG